MSDLEFRMWDDRINHADEVWKDHGLHDDASPGIHFSRVLNAYRGNQWTWTIPTLSPEEHITNNVMYEMVNLLLSDLFARNPQVDVVSESRDKVGNASRMERLLNFLMAADKLQIKRQVNRSLLDAILMPFGVVRHGFTPTEEKFDRNGNLIDRYDPAKPDFPWIRRVAPWDLRIDPLAETLDPDGDARWCAFRTLLFPDDVRSNPNMIFREDLKATRRVARSTFTMSKREDRSGEASELIELWTVYDKVERKWFSISPGSQKPIREPEDWPIPWESLPFNVLQFNPTPDDAIGISPAEQILPLQLELNIVMTILNVLAKSTRRLIGVNDDAMEDSEFQKLTEELSLAEFFKTKGVGPPAAAIQEIKVGQFPQELVLYTGFLIDQIRKKIGLSEMDRGQRINVESSAEAQFVNAGASRQRGRNQGPFEDFFSGIVTTLGQSIQNTLTDDFAIPILGTQDAEELFSESGESAFSVIEPSKIRGEFLYRIRPGSTLPYDPGENIRRELALNQALAPFGEIVNLPQRAIDTVVAFEKDPARQLASPQLMQERERVGAAQGTPPGTPVDTSGGIDASTVNLIASGLGNRGNGAVQ